VRTRPACGEGSAELQCGAYLAERGLATLSLREGIAVAQTARASQLLSVVIQPPPFASGRGSGVSAGALAEEDAQGEGGRIYIYTAAFGDGLWPHEIVRDSLHHAARAAAPRLSRRGPVYTLSRPRSLAGVLVDWGKRARQMRRCVLGWIAGCVPREVHTHRLASGRLRRLCVALL